MKKFIALIVLLQLGIIAGANENSSKEGVDVIATKETIVSGPTDRHQSISADITGNTLTITFNDNVGIAHIVVKDSKSTPKRDVKKEEKEVNDNKYIFINY